MSGKRSQLAQELGRFAEALWLEIPAAMAQQVLGNGNESVLSAAGWKAYDAWVSLTNEATNRVYENAAVGAVTGRAMESALRMQQVGSTVASALLNNLWPALGLPTADQVAGLRSEIAALQNGTGDSAAASKEHPTSTAGHKAVEDGLKLIRGSRQGSHVYMKSSGEEKDHAAA